jgi:hypothetical protein
MQHRQLDQRQSPPQKTCHESSSYHRAYRPPKSELHIATVVNQKLIISPCWRAPTIYVGQDFKNLSQRIHQASPHLKIEPAIFILQAGVVS